MIETIECLQVLQKIREAMNNKSPGVALELLDRAIYKMKKRINDFESQLEKQED
jgi:hypothetical protein